MKKLSSLLFALILCVSLVGCSSSDEPTIETNTPEPTTTSVTTQPTETPQSKLEINIQGGELGEYGSEITFNADTEFEETRVVYHIPAGTYSVTNKGSNMNQFNIYSDEKVKTEEGWEEPAEVIFGKLLDVDAIEEFTITDTQYIYVMDGNWQIVEK